MNSQNPLGYLLLSVALFACDGQQYVSPGTVDLSISNDKTGVERVNRCNWVPILLGSEVKARYVIEGDLKATISVTREDIDVTFEGEDTGESLHVSPKELDACTPDFCAGTLTANGATYSVKLDSGCTPDED